ncbi:MAG: IMP cyclohydrolase [Oscillospiraceae bacterium]
MKQDIFSYLRGNRYPGRGILLGRAGDTAVLAYFIMGRSENSRNRIFVPTEDGIRTQAKDPAKMQDPSLVIYHPVRQVGGDVVVTNGDQTDTIRDFLTRGESFEAALRTREFEPDYPNCTPRISGILRRGGSYTLSILKADGTLCQRQFFEYLAQSGVGHFISTYQGDGNPLPSFAGEPIAVALEESDPAKLAARLWESLNDENRVSLFVRSIDMHTGGARTKVINRYGEDWESAQSEGESFDA